MFSVLLSLLDRGFVPHLRRRRRDRCRLGLRREVAHGDERQVLPRLAQAVAALGRRLLRREDALERLAADGLDGLEQALARAAAAEHVVDDDALGAPRDAVEVERAVARCWGSPTT